MLRAVELELGGGSLERWEGKRIQEPGTDGAWDQGLEGLCALQPVPGLLSAV